MQGSSVQKAGRILSSVGGFDVIINTNGFVLRQQKRC